MSRRPAGAAASAARSSKLYGKKCRFQTYGREGLKELPADSEEPAPADAAGGGAADCGAGAVASGLGLQLAGRAAQAEGGGLGLADLEDPGLVRSGHAGVTPSRAAQAIVQR